MSGKFQELKDISKIGLKELEDDIGTISSSGDDIDSNSKYKMCIGIVLI